jgi:hypothetical protein
MSARRLAPGVVAPTRQRRPAKTVELEEAFGISAAEADAETDSSLRAPFRPQLP